MVNIIQLLLLLSYAKPCLSRFTVIFLMGDVNFTNAYIKEKNIQENDYDFVNF